MRKLRVNINDRLMIDTLDSNTYKRKLWIFRLATYDAWGGHKYFGSKQEQRDMDGWRNHHCSWKLLTRKKNQYEYNRSSKEN